MAGGRRLLTAASACSATHCAAEDEVVGSAKRFGATSRSNSTRDNRLTISASPVIGRDTPADTRGHACPIASMFTGPALGRDYARPIYRIETRWICVAQLAQRACADCRQRSTSRTHRFLALRSPNERRAIPAKLYIEPTEEQHGRHVQMARHGSIWITVITGPFRLPRTPARTAAPPRLRAWPDHATKRAATGGRTDFPPGSVYIATSAGRAELTV